MVVLLPVTALTCSLYTFQLLQRPRCLWLHLSFESKPVCADHGVSWKSARGCLCFTELTLHVTKCLL